jgi:2-C-methyl-D-erythritol 4-phosphate cytidylyltransferase
MSIITDAIIVAAGSGNRLGFSIPKAFVPLGGRPLLSWSIETFLAHPIIRQVILVIPQNMHDETKSLFSNPRIKCVIGGAERWHSVRNGVKFSDAECVLVHDAARPFVSTKVIDAIIEKTDKYKCVFTATPVVDTIRSFCGDKAGETVDREKLLRVGTPQFFNREQLINAFDTIRPEDPIPTDEVMLMQKTGIDAGIAWGDPNNFKITTVEDLNLAEALVAKK